MPILSRSGSEQMRNLLATLLLSRGRRCWSPAMSSPGPKAGITMPIAG